MEGNGGNKGHNKIILLKISFYHVIFEPSPKN